MAEQQFQTKSLKRKNVKNLALNPTPKAEQKPKNVQTDTLEIGLEFKLDLRSEDLIPLKEVGAGNGGTVSKVKHATTGVIMARKIIRVDAKENVRKQILRELQLGQECNSPYIVTYYGAFQNESRDIVLCMEYMDCGSLDRISKEYGPVRVDVLGKITESILAGLVYLYENHRIMHRDIKPSNVLVNSRGHIKLCDFGVATETVNSLADTFVGTSTYMAPERIQGGAYTVRSDVWSVGLTVMELAVGRFPFDTSESSAGDRASAGPMGILDLLQQIVHEPSPKLPKSDAFPPILHEFVAKCLLKRPEERPTPRELYDKDAFLQAAKRTPVDLEAWALSVRDSPPRRSHRESTSSRSSHSHSHSRSHSNQSAAQRAPPQPSAKPPPPPPQPHARPTPPPPPASTSGEIPLSIYNTSTSSSHVHAQRAASRPPTSRPHHPAYYKDPVQALEHLSLESKDVPPAHPAYYGYQSSRDRERSSGTRSAVDERPPFLSRTASSENTKGSFHQTVLSPPPPVPSHPSATSEPWRNQYSART
ncbi:hypothetical protein VTN49DRAFT_1618 [Thermomyces lanuginosus]|uniref:uncharacterized protein n=1 Tax=Thermomyces lanuginosus TaxID=5541 RepID=UPI003744A9E0